MLDDLGRIGLVLMEGLLEAVELGETLRVLRPELLFEPVDLLGLGLANLELLV